MQKKQPGVDWNYYVYNYNDRLVLSQDGDQRLSNQWTVAKYDVLGREVITGVWNAGSVISQSTLQSSIYAASQYETRDAGNNGTANPTGYVIGSYPSLSNVLTVNYYDDYLFLGNPYANITSLQTARVAPAFLEVMLEPMYTAVANIVTANEAEQKKKRKKRSQGQQITR